MEIIKLEVYKLARELHCLSKLVGSQSNSFESIVKDITENESAYATQLKILHKAPKRKTKNIRASVLSLSR